jgi:large subunit ribosomal protein L3
VTCIVGKKLGMTQIFAEDGTVVPVTVIEAQPGCVVQVKTRVKDGYEAVQIGFFEEKRESRMNKPALGTFKKRGLKPYRTLREFAMEGLSQGDSLTVERFQKGDIVAVTSTSKGKGFQGVMKRHNFKGGPGGHGSMFNRAPGSIGASSYPSRVWPGQKMAGHMGSDTVTVRNLKVVDVRPEQNLILLRGAVPGGAGAIVEIRKDA